jgi:hypothetical protein
MDRLLVPMKLKIDESEVAMPLLLVIIDNVLPAPVGHSEEIEFQVG